MSYDVPRAVTPLASVVLADNPGPMTLDGTNTWVLRAPGAPGAIVVDPGPADDAHLAAVLAAAGEVALIVVTHRHPDHTDGAAALAERTGAVVRAADPAFRTAEADGLAEDDVIEAAGVRLRVLATPGHTSDSVSLLLDDGDGGDAAVLTGDTILGRGTTVVAHPDGDLASYLASLHRLAEIGVVTVLPGHGPELPDLSAVAEHYLAHREQRLAQVRAALAQLGPDVTARQVVELVYADVDAEVWDAAELSVEAQLAYLRSG